MDAGIIRGPGRNGTDKVVVGMPRTFSAYRTAFRLKSMSGVRIDLSPSSRMVRSGTVRPDAPLTSPVAASPTIGALENWPGRDPSGSVPFAFSVGCKLAMATSTLPLRSEEHTSELQSRGHLVCRLLLEKKKKTTPQI